MSTPQEFLQRIGLIVGDNVSDGEVNLHLSWSNYSEARALLTRIRTVQREMRLLKKDVSATISAVRSEYSTARIKVGKSVGSGIASALFGARSVGRYNSARRDDLRRSQLRAIEPYDNVKRIVDQILHQLDVAKGRIELSPEFQIRAPRTTLDERPQPPPALPRHNTRRFFAFIAEQVKGPYTIEQLQALHDASTISHDTQCCQEGTENWRLYSQIMDDVERAPMGNDSGQ